MGGHVTTKVHVYSYEIVLLEILTRKKPTHNIFVEGMNLLKREGSDFLNRVKVMVNGSILRRTSMGTIEDKELNCLTQLISMGLLCTKESPEARPTMMTLLVHCTTSKRLFWELRGFQNVKISKHKFITAKTDLFYLLISQ